MKVIAEALNGVLLLEPTIYHDNRGFFFESWNQTIFERLNIPFHFVQDNQSHSSKNVIRGLHFQKAPYEQGKLVRVVKGAAVDVAVDIRPGSHTFMKHFKAELSENNFRMMWIPPGFAHGFAALENNTIFLYKCTSYYNKNAESGIIYNDPELGIDWEIENAIVSEKDLALPFLEK